MTKFRSLLEWERNTSLFDLLERGVTLNSSDPSQCARNRLTNPCHALLGIKSLKSPKYPGNVSCRPNLHRENSTLIIGVSQRYSFALSFPTQWYPFLMKLMGGDWSRGDFLAAFGLILAAIGVIAAILAVPGMPKIAHWDSEPSVEQGHWACIHKNRD
jgi:hypothetical protein